ncbi:MAG: shikimate kinase [Oscillospiraceae bacterium]
MQYGLLGEKLGHSFSPQIHALFGLPDYELIEVSPGNLDKFLNDRNFDAINVTIPYKQSVIPYCTELSASASAIGAVNTIVNRSGKLYGANTDYLGFCAMASRAGISFSGKKVLVLGSGGTSLTASAAARDGGCRKHYTVSRHGEINYENVYERHGDADILINTTPVGMYPNNGTSAVDPERFPNLCGVLDVVYNPLKTALILKAHKLGIPASGGLPMLVAQAKYAEELFFNRKIPDEKLESVLRKIDAQKRNIILMGMPGCGKSSLGYELSLLTNRPLRDIDELIVHEAGCSIPEIFEKSGEAVFRDIESAVLLREGKQGGSIISLGGGSILREENRAAIIQNGFLVYVRRALDRLPTSGRPLSTDVQALQHMYAVRGPIYSAYADCVCENSGTIRELAKEVLGKFDNREI